MSSFSFHTTGVSFLVRFILLCAVIFFAARSLSRELPRFLADEQFFNAMGVEISIPRHVLAAAAPADPIIYDRNEEAAAKRDSLIAEKSNFLFADLATMSVSLYAKGQKQKTFAILAAGAIGSFFEMPNGFFEIESKEEKHFSDIADVMMPWTMALSGNYVIHGVPVYPNGRPVEAAYRGGGIRLATADAKELFRTASTTLPVVVAGEESTGEAKGRYFKKISSAKREAPSGSLPRLSAASAIAADMETGQILFEKQPDTQHPLASVTKLMTALIAQETIVSSKYITVNETAVNTSGDTGRLRAGDTFQAKDLLYPLILASSNDAATAYAEEVTGFVDLMNQKARTLGLGHTHYKDSSGLTHENVSSARDLLVLLTYINRHQQKLLEISSLPQYAIVADNKLHSWRNSTWPDNNGVFLGGKFGFTPEARQTLAAIFGVNVSEHGARPIAIILLSSNDRRRDAMLIMNHLRKTFAYASTLAAKTYGPALPVIRAGANVFEAFPADAK